MNNLVWFRNDLRVNDNNSLSNATLSRGKTIAVYCFDPRHYALTSYGLKKTEKYRAQFLLETIAELQKNLLKKNITLLTYFDTPENVFENICNEFQISKVYLQLELTDEENKVLQNVQSALKSNNLKWIETPDQFLFHPEDIPYQNINQLPHVFTVFRKECEKKVQIRKTVSITVQPENNLIENLTAIPTLNELGLENFEKNANSSFPFSGGENQALRRIENYFFETKNLSQYKQTRNGLIGSDYSSKLSAWLANGSISAKTIY